MLSDQTCWTRGLGYLFFWTKGVLKLTVLLSDGNWEQSDYAEQSLVKKKIKKTNDSTASHDLAAVSVNAP